MPSPIRLAIAGVGNCASSLVQGITYYRDADPDDVVPGPHARRARAATTSATSVPVAAFDVDQAKVGTDLGKAIHAGQNNTVRFAEVGELGVTVQRGPTFDGLGKYYREVVEESPAEPVDVAAALRDAEADVLVSYLPVGSEQAQRHYAQACLDAGVAFVNAIPVFIASDPEWARKFRDAGVPIVGDDIKSQVGSTIVHRILTRLFEDRGLALDHTYQLNFGGNMDFKNMLERERLESKKISKTQAVTSQIEDNVLDADDVHVGPVGPRAVAEGPQVGLHPHGGPQLRRRAAQPGAQARGVGLPQLGRRHHRRRALRQAGARPRHRRPAARPVGLLHEVAAGAVPRRRGPRAWSRRSPPGDRARPGRPTEHRPVDRRSPDLGPRRRVRLARSDQDALVGRAHARPRRGCGPCRGTCRSRW